MIDERPVPERPVPKRPVPAHQVPEPQVPEHFPVEDELQVVDRIEDFSAFFARERRQVIGLAYVLSGSARVAEDLSQEAFLAALKNWDRVSRLDSPGAWVRKVVANGAVSFLRRARIEAKAMVRFGADPAVDITSELPQPTSDLLSAVRKLPRRQAQSIALFYWDGLSAPEIGRILGCSAVSINTHLQRARKSLAATIDWNGEL